MSESAHRLAATTGRLSPGAAAYQRLVLGRPLLTLLAVLAVSAALGWGLTRLEIDASSDSLVLQGDADLAYARDVSDRYGGQDLCFVTYRDRQGQLFTPEGLDRLRSLRNDLSALAGVADVRTILDAPLLEAAGSLEDVEQGLPTLDTPGVAPDDAREELTTSPLYRQLLISEDGRTTALAITFTDPPSGGTTDPRQRSRRIIADLRAVLDQHRGSAELFLGGVRMIADDMITFVRRDLRVFGLGGLATLTLALAVLFRRLRWVALPLACCALSVIWLGGLVGWLGWQLTVISCNALALQLIMTLAVAVHLAVRHDELAGDRPDAPARELAGETARLKFWPCAFAALTTQAGFVSLLLADLLPVIMLGRIMILGLAIALVVPFVVIPAGLALLPVAPPSPSRRKPAPLTDALARLTERRGRWVLAGAGLVLALGAVGIARLRVENRFIDYFHPSTEIHQGMALLDRELGGTTPLDVIVQLDPPQADLADTPAASAERPPDDAGPDAPAPADGFEAFDEFEEFDDLIEDNRGQEYWFTRDKLRRVQAAHHYLQDLPHTGKVLSLASLLEIIQQIKGDAPVDSFDLAFAYRQTPPELRRIAVAPYADVEAGEVRLAVRVRDSDPGLRRDQLLHRVRDELPAVLDVPPARVRLSGLLVLYNNMLQSLWRSQILTLGATMALLTVMFLILFRSPVVSAVALVPNVLPVVVVLGAMGWGRLPLDMMTMTIAAITVGIAVDDTIHYLHRFRDEVRSGRTYPAALRRSHRTIGRAMKFTSAAIVVGLVPMLASDFLPTVYFALLTAGAMMVALLADLTLLPAVILRTRPFAPRGEPQKGV